MKTWFLLILGALGMALAGCPSPPNPTPGINPPDLSRDLTLAPPAHDGGVFPSCPPTEIATQANICPDIFTADGHACVICQGGMGCIDHTVEVYCTTGPCADDANCLRAGTSAMSKRPSKKRTVK